MGGDAHRPRPEDRAAAPGVPRGGAAGLPAARGARVALASGPGRPDGRGLDVLFDLDGTLTDAAIGITRCLQHALRELGRPIPDATALVRYVGPPLQASLVALLPDADARTLAEALRLYRERYAAVGMFENAVYPGVVDGLQALASRGHRLWVATSKPHVFARRILEHFGLAHRFSGIYGSELDGRRTDKGELIGHLLAREQLSPERCWMVGDRAHDVRGARVHGLRAVAVRWGYGTDAELRAAGPDYVVDSMHELCAYLGGGR